MIVSSSSRFVHRHLIFGCVLALLAAGCGGEGEGTIKIENPEAVRAKATGAIGATGKESPKEAKAKELEAEAAKKHPKLN